MLIEPVDAARARISDHVDPDDFDAFWAGTLAEAGHDIDVRLRPVETELALVDVQDVTFAGSGGTDVRAWLRTPRGATGPLPTVVSYVGYGGGRGRAEETLIYAAAGFAHLQMDTRGQGSFWSAGDTADDGAAGPAIPGFMTRGISSREGYYYRRLFTDAVRAVDAAKTLDVVDPARIAVQGGSQGGGMALAVAGLRDDLAAVSAYVPFLCDIARATRVTDAYPYHEVVDYLKTHRERAADVLGVLRYFDGVAFARRATAPARFSVGLMDATSPPSTVFGAFNAYAAEAEIVEWEFNGHEGGGIDDELGTIEFLRRRMG